MKRTPRQAARAPRRQSALPCALVTGFAPFDGEAINPSAQIAHALDGEIIAGHRIVGAELATEFARSLPALEALLETHRPRLVIAMGQAGGRCDVALERVAINLIDARLPDNAGAQPIDVPVVAGAPAAYFATLPVKALLQRLRDAGIPASLSHSAGTFVCNQVFFALAHLLAQNHPATRGGFVHLPYLPEQAAKFSGAPSMALPTMLAAARLCLETALTTFADLHFAAGTSH
jgi:pyroglutamyl-peptidase